MVANLIQPYNRNDAPMPALYELNNEACEDGDSSIKNIALDDQRDPQGAGKAADPRESRSETDTSFVTVLKDFFKSTFSDHYPNEGYCGIPGIYCCRGQSEGRNGPEIYDIANEPQLDLQHSISQGSEVAAQWPRRKKALAVATGYRYAEDMDGRPVVIVPGTRKAPIDLTDYHAQSHFRRHYIARQPLVGPEQTAA